MRLLGGRVVPNLRLEGVEKGKEVEDWKKWKIWTRNIRMWIAHVQGTNSEMKEE